MSQEDEIRRLRQQIAAAEQQAAEEKERRLQAERLAAEETEQRIQAERLAAEEKEHRAQAERLAAEEKEQRIHAEQHAKEAERRAAEEQEQRIRTEVRAEKTQFLPCVLFRHCLMLSRLSVEPNPDKLAKGRTTSVTGKYYPKTLTKWSEFPNLHREQFLLFCRTFDDRKLFPSFLELSGASESISNTPVGSETQQMPYHVQFEAGIKDLFSQYLRIVSPDRPTRVTFSHDYITLANRTTGTSNSASASSAQDSPSAPALSRSVAASSGTAGGLLPSPSFKVHNKPDSWCLRVDQIPASSVIVEDTGTLETRTPIFVQDYKALHKVPPQAVLGLLGSDAPQTSLIADLRRFRGERSPRTGSPSPQVTLADIRANTAASLAQNFHYMIEYGLRYSCISTGEGLILLHFNPDTPTTMYYHLATPKDDVVLPEIPGDVLEARQFAHDHSEALCNTAIAKVMTLASLAWSTTPQQDEWSTTVVTHLKKWPNPYDGAQSPVASRSSSRKRRKDDDDDANQRGGPARLPPPSQSRPGDREAGGSGAASSTTGGQQGGADLTIRGPHVAQNTFVVDRPITQNPPHRPPLLNFCTQACLNGLRTSGPLDPNCPNVLLHLDRRSDAPASQASHPLSTQEFLDKVQEQLSASLVDDWEALDKFGMYGAIGALFKLTLRDYGYTLVAKGVQSVDRRRLEKEVHIYDVLSDLQGRRIPVCLGTVDLVRKYRLMSGVRIARILLMSFGGLNLATYDDIDIDVDAEANEILDEIRAKGIEHGDVRPYNILWNPTTSSLMAVDFDRAYVTNVQGRKRSASFDPPPNKRVAYCLTGEEAVTEAECPDLH